ncbi:MAG: CotH kinase family protein [Clostridiales bacterium]
MINNKYYNKLVITLVLISIGFSIILIFRYNGKSYDSSIKTDYESKIFDKNNIIKLDINIEEEDWKWLIDNASLEEYKTCNILINDTTINNVGIRPKGNSSLSMVSNDTETDRFSFKLDFDEYVKGQTCFGLDKLSLNNIMADNTYMKEAISYDMFSMMGISTPLYNYVDIKINGEQWGFYLAVETLEESFVQRNYGSLTGNLYKPEGEEMGLKGGNVSKGDLGRPEDNKMDQGNKGDNIGDLYKPEANEMVQGYNKNNQKNYGDFDIGAMHGGGKNGTNLVWSGEDVSNYSGITENAVLNTTTSYDFDKVVKMIKNLNNGTNLEKYLDVDEILKYFAVNTFLVNLDSYAGDMKHNYYLYENDGIFQILPWDFNLAFGGFNSGSSTETINFPIDVPVSGDINTSPLIGKLLEVDEYKNTYHEYLEEIADNYVNNKEMEKSIKSIDDKISEYVKNDKTKFCTFEEYEKSLSVLIKYGEDRAKSISDQLSGKQPSDTTGNVETSINLTDLGSMGKNGAFKMDGMDREKMREAMEIVGESDNGEITDDQLKQLKELGLDDEAIEMIKKMPRNINGRDDMEMGKEPGKDNKEDGNKEEVVLENEDSKQKKINLATSIIVLIAGFGFVLKYNRKRYV